MEGHEPGLKCSNKDPEKEKTPLHRKWASEPSANTKRSTFADPEAKNRESLPCGAAGGAAPQQKYAITGNCGKLLSGVSAVCAMGGPISHDPPGAFAQGFPRGYSFPLGQPYPQHPQSKRFLSGAKPQPGLEPHAWPYVGQLPSDDLYPVGHTSHSHPHGAGTGRFPRQKSPSLPSSFGQYSQSGAEGGDEGYSKKEQKPKKPGRYICNFCGRACAKPSVLKKHIRSHTGERPYPCVPCGFSFKTKSNLYKHRKSHAHAIKAGLVPFSELALARSTDGDQASPIGDPEVHSDGEQSTDTDEECAEGSTMLTDKDFPVPQISFETDKNTGRSERPYGRISTELPIGSIKVPILIVPKAGGVPSAGIEFSPFHDMKGHHHMLASQVGGRAHSLDDAPSIKQRLALRLNEKKGQDSEIAMSQSLNHLSPHGKGSTDSGYFSRSESAEQPISPPNTNVKTYEEIMFGRTWYYRPSARPRQSITVGMAGVDSTSLAALKQSGATMPGDHIAFRGDVRIPGDPKLFPTGHSPIGTGLLEPPSETGRLPRSNSMPTSSPPLLSVPQGNRSHSFDNMAAPDDVFLPPGHPRLKRQSAFEHHTGEAEAFGHMAKSLATPHGLKFGVTESFAYGSHGTKVSTSENRKRRKEESVGDDEDSPGHCDSSCSGSLDMVGDYEFRQGSFDGCRATPTGKGSLHSAHSQSDSFDTCPSMCSDDMAFFMDSEGRKAAGNVISVIQHTNSLSRPSSFDKSESFDQPGYQPSDKAPSSQYSEQSDSEIFEDALSPESALLKTESMEHQLHSDSELASSSSATASPGQSYQMQHKLVRQPNIQVPEIRVTEEPDKPERDVEALSTKEPEKPQHVEEFQLPQRSDTLAQMPSEKLPPKKKRLRLADMEHSSGESSFESTCNSLSRSPSQESNLSHSSSLSMSFDRDEGLKSVSPTKQDESSSSGANMKQSEFLTVPGSGFSSHHQQREMRRSSSEQAPCTLATEFPEMRSQSFDYGSLSPCRQGEPYPSASAMKERQRGYLVRQASLSVYPEAVTQEPEAVEVSIKQESLDHGAWPGPLGPSHGSDVSPRTKRIGSNSGGDGPPFLSGMFWSSDVDPRHLQTAQAQQQLQKLHIRPKPTFDQLQHDAPSHSISSARPLFAAQSSAQTPLQVPVRLQTNVPSFGSIMYTSVSQLIASPGSAGDHIDFSNLSPSVSAGSVSETPPGGIISHLLGQTDGASLRYLSLNTGIPLSLTSGTISTTDASGSGVGGSKRMLSPTSSLELFMTTKQQKRVRDERMYGQILKEMSAVELSGAENASELEKVGDIAERMSSSPPPGEFTLTVGKILVPVRSSPPHRQDVQRVESFTPPLQIITDRSPVPGGRESPEELDVDHPERNSSPESMVSSSNDAEDDSKQPIVGKGPGRMVVGLPADQSPGSALLLTGLEDSTQFFQFPSLRTSSRVSWCFLNYTKPSSRQAAPHTSVYGAWSVSAYNPNPLKLSTKAALALLRSKQRKVTDLIYTIAVASPPSSGKLVSSVAWKLRFDQLMPVDVDVRSLGRKMKGVVAWDRSKEEPLEKEVSVKQTTAEPTRIKIFEGGFKSNEDYVYVRGRGRGKYICEECGIRCKKPSMLKKHIRTHTDVRPYVCKFCNFAFKTKGNLTKHMKSKAHMKKCLELGVSTSSVEDGEADDGDDGHRVSEKASRVMADHQFSDADDSEEDGDDVDDEDDDEDDYDGDSTPRTRSCSTSPQPYLSVTAVAASHSHPVSSRPPPPVSPLLGFLTSVPSIHIITPQPGGRVAPPPVDEDLTVPSPELDRSRCPSPVSPCSSPSARRYLSHHRDLSPRHMSSKREWAVGGHREDVSPRRGPLSLLSPRPSSPGGRDYKRDLSPRGRHRGMIRPLSPRRGPHQHLRHHRLETSTLQGRQRFLSVLQDLGSGSPWEPDPRGNRGNQSSLPHQVLFSHLPLHSQHQVFLRAPLPMIPIGGIQMVQSVPLTQSGLSPRNSTSEDSCTNQTSAFNEREIEGGAEGGGGEGGVEQEENLQTCTRAIASLCIASEDGGRDGAAPSPSSSDSHQHFSPAPSSIQLDDIRPQTAAFKPQDEAS
uniref:C2H2-type domain-containing protein n=1 Tax=Gouania willdenowi TaxID=441366 RepID=A0A8C5DVC1_GOUWI